MIILSIILMIVTLMYFVCYYGLNQSVATLPAGKVGS